MACTIYGFQDRPFESENAKSNDIKNLRQSGHFSTAPGQRGIINPSPDLLRVIDAWDQLPDAIRAGIGAMVRATIRGTDNK
jgi:hypothetical protein